MTDADNYNQVAFCADYDPTTSLIYGVFLNDEGGHFQIGTLDPTTFTRVSTLRDDPSEDIMGLDFDDNGVLYAITAQGTLGTIDKKRRRLQPHRRHRHSVGTAQRHCRRLRHGLRILLALYRRR